MRTNYYADSYERLIRIACVDGGVIPSRYGDTAELRGLQVRLVPGDLVHRSRINYGIGWMEALQLIAGTWDADRIKAVAPNADHSLFTDQMAYGPRIVLYSHEKPTRRGAGTGEWAFQPSIDQLAKCVNTLKNDPGSRQALVFIARPWELCSSDLPCTLTMQFLVRDHVLHAAVTMRSWDLLKGLPYDIMMFGALQQVMASLVTNYQTGELIITAGSAHVYLDEVERLVPDHSCGHFYLPSGLDSLKTYRTWAFQQLHGDWVGKKGGVPEGIKVIDHDRRVKRKD